MLHEVNTTFLSQNFLYFLPINNMLKNFCKENVYKYLQKYTTNIIKKGLYVAATPIGNINDVSKRTITIFENSDL
jgi:hypothetical protein